MNSTVGEAYADELVKLFEQQGSSLYDGQHSLCLTTPCLHYLQWKFSAIQEASTDPVPVKFAVLHHLQDSLAKIVSLKLIADKLLPLPPTATLNLEPFKALHTLTLKKVSIQTVIGLQRLRSQLKVLIIQRCQVENIEDVIVRCGGDDSTSFAWNSLKELDLSNNSITTLGDSLQYLPCLEKVNFSNNYIGTDTRDSVPPEGPPASNGGQSASNGVQNSSGGGVASGSGGSIVDSAEGIICVENVTFLHLGFNKLKTIPRFATKAKYNLTVLNLRNNELENIEGLNELDSLVELDLTDNLLTKHSSLSPVKNLHHLAVLTLQGNPLSFHHKHRLKTADNLSNLISKNTFRLDGRKLTAAEKKVVSNSLTHYPGSGAHSVASPSSGPLAATSPDSQQTVQIVQNGLINSVVEDNGRVTDPNARFYQGTTPVVSSQESAVGKKSRKTKGWHTARIIDSEDEEIAPDRETHRSKEDLTVGSVPLIHEQHLNKIEQVRKQLEDDWIKTINSVESSSTGTEDRLTSASHSFVVSSQSNSQPSSQSSSLKRVLPGRKGSVQTSPSRKTSLESSNSSTKSRGKRQKRVKRAHESGDAVRVVEDVEEVREEECEGMFGPRTSSPDRGPTPSNIGGDCFLVERYESDDEEDDSLHKDGRGRFQTSNNETKTKRGVYTPSARMLTSSSLLYDTDEGNQVVIVLTERFLEEKSSQGKLIDRWDLNCLEEASISERPWRKGKTRDTKMFNVLFLKFNLDRRDRCRREYVLLEDGVNESLLGMLNPVIEQNKATLSVENKLECLHCQRVFDKSQALDEPSDNSHPLPLGSYKSRSLSKLMCPFCHSQVLQYSSLSNKPFISGASTSASPRQRLSAAGSNNGAAANSDSFHNVITSTNQTKSGFEVTNENQDESTPLVGLKELDVDKELEIVDDSFMYENAGPREDLETSEGSKRRSSGGSEHERDTWSGEATSGKKKSPEDDHLSPWKVQRKKEKALDCSGNSDCVMTRPRADAICEPDNYNDVSSLLESCEHHSVLHKDAAKYEDPTPRSSNPFDAPHDVPHGTQLQTDSNTSRNKYDVMNVLPINELETSTSVPSESKIHTYLESGLSSGKLLSISTESAGHSRSKSVDCHPRVSHNVTPPSARKKYFDPYANEDDNQTRSSLSSLKEGESLINDQLTCGSKNSSSSVSRNSSGKSSLLSLDGRDSPHSKSDGRGSPNRKSDGRDSPHRKSDGRDSPRRKSDGRDSPRRKVDVDFAFRGYSSGEAKKPSRTKHDKGYSSGDRLISSRGYTSSECASRRRDTTGSSIPRVHSHGDICGSPGASRRQVVGKNDKQGRSKWDFLPGSPKKSGNLRTSSDEVKRPSSLILCKDDDPTYIDSNLNLYLDIEVFNLEKREEFKLVFRSPVVQYGHSKEMPSLVVISSLCVYIFRITAPENSTPSKWLELMATHLLRRLVFIDIGVGYQFLRVEFKVQNACYTFLLRDKEKCTSLSTKIAFIVSDVPKASLRTVGVCPFSIDTVRHPERALREVLMVRYEKLTGSRSHTPTRGLSSQRPASSLGGSPDDDDLVLYRLAHKRVSGKPQVPGPVPVTVILTKTCLYMAKENFTHWPLPRIQELPNRDSLKPPYSEVQQRDITDIEQIVLDRDQTTQVKIRFFRENVTENEERQWCLIMHSSACVDKLVSSIKVPWEVSFQTDLPIIHK